MEYRWSSARAVFCWMRRERLRWIGVGRMGGRLFTDKLVFRWLEFLGAWSLDSATPATAAYPAHASGSSPQPSRETLLRKTRRQRQTQEVCTYRLRTQTPHDLLRCCQIWKAFSNNHLTRQHLPPQLLLLTLPTLVARRNGKHPNCAPDKQIR